MDNICKQDIGTVSGGRGMNSGMIQVQCMSGAYGRYVYLLPRSGSTDPLTLCEIEVYGDEGECL